VLSVARSVILRHRCRYAECRYGEGHYGERRYAKCNCAKCRDAVCHYAKRRYAECRGSPKISAKVMYHRGISICVGERVT
jgi:hypothetical protein